MNETETMWISGIEIGRNLLEPLKGCGQSDTHLGESCYNVFSHIWTMVPTPELKRKGDIRTQIPQFTYSQP